MFWTHGKSPVPQQKGDADDILEAAERCANLLEGAEMVPMWDLPSATIADWRAQPEEERDLLAIRNLPMNWQSWCREKLPGSVKQTKKL
jgi:hypothetical protein